MMRIITDWIRTINKPQYPIAEISIIITTLLFTWTQRYIHDDPFISFRYARNLAAGNGLVYNVGEYVEGYSNFLWTLLMAIPHALNIDPILFAHLIGTMLLLVSLVMIGLIGRRMLKSRLQTLFLLIVICLNYSFTTSFVNGLETGLVNTTILLSFYLTITYLEKTTLYWKTALLTSLLFAVALLTRLDAVVMLFPLGGFILISILRTQPITNRWKSIAAFVIPVSTILLLWFTWRYFYYGELLPNTFYAKVSLDQSFGRGVQYLATFAISYPLIFLPILMITNVRAIKQNLPLFLLTAIILAWFGYILIIGGDHLEFRMLAPILPLIYLLYLWLANKYSIKKALVLSSLLLFIPLTYYASFDDHGYHRFNYLFANPKALEAKIYHPNSSWQKLGEVLGQDLTYDPSVVIAVTPAGAIPYYSELTTIDMLGLNDKWVARREVPHMNFPGHLRIATLSYLLARGTHLFIAHPVPRFVSEPTEFTIDYVRNYNHLYLGELTDIPHTTSVLEIPLYDHSNIIALYLNKHPAIEKAIQQHGWINHQIQYENPDLLSN